MSQRSAAEPEVWVFFYGSYMNRRVLAEVELVPARFERASVAGFDIVIAPRANLVREPSRVVWGALATATHRELARLYAHAEDVLGERYLPEAVLAATAAGDLRPALCYIAPAMAPAPPDPAYVERIVVAAEELGLPAPYVERLRGFAPAA